jgi:hypothetical protein
LGSFVNVEELNDVVLAVGRDMACGCVDVKRVNVSDGARREAMACGCELANCWRSKTLYVWFGV